MFHVANMKVVNYIAFRLSYICLRANIYTVVLPLCLFPNTCKGLLTK